jgi:hypothetical protein
MFPIADYSGSNLTPRSSKICRNIETFDRFETAQYPKDSIINMDLGENLKPKQMFLQEEEQCIESDVDGFVSKRYNNMRQWERELS